MKRTAPLLIALALAALFSGSATAATAKSVPLTLAYGNDVRGELAPCG